MRIAVVCAFGSVVFAALAANAEPAPRSADASAACASGSAAACRDLGDRAHDRKDYRAASDRYEQGCRLGEGESCGRLGFGFLEGTGRPKDPVKAAALFEQACGKAEEWCGMLGQLYANGHGVERDAPRALELFRRGCLGGMPNFCER